MRVVGSLLVVLIVGFWIALGDLPVGSRVLILMVALVVGICVLSLIGLGHNVLVGMGVGMRVGRTVRLFLEGLLGIVGFIVLLMMAITLGVAAWVCDELGDPRAPKPTKLGGDRSNPPAPSRPPVPPATPPSSPWIN